MNNQKSRYSDYGKKIKRRLLEKEMSQKELADLLGIDHRRMSDIVRGVFAGLKYRDRINQILDLAENEIAS